MTSLEAMDQRLDQLARQNRRLRILVLLCLILVLGLALGEGMVFSGILMERLTARWMSADIYYVEGNGANGGGSLSPDGLSLKARREDRKPGDPDRSGNESGPAASVALDARRGLEFRREGDLPHVSITPDSNPRIVFRDSEGAARVEIGVVAGQAKILLRDAKGNVLHQWTAP